MPVHRTNRLGVPTLQVHGPMTTCTWQVFLVDLRAVIGEGHPRIALDLSGVTWMGRWQAEVLLKARDRLDRTQRALSLVGLSPAAITALSRAATRKRSPS